MRPRSSSICAREAAPQNEKGPAKWQALSVVPPGGQDDRSTLSDQYVNFAVKAKRSSHWPNEPLHQFAIAPLFFTSVSQ